MSTYGGNLDAKMGLKFKKSLLAAPLTKNNNLIFSGTPSKMHVVESFVYLFITYLCRISKYTECLYFRSHVNVRIDFQLTLFQVCFVEGQVFSNYLKLRI